MGERKGPAEHFGQGDLGAFGTAEDDPVGCLHHLLRAAAGNGRSLGERLSMALTDPAEARKVRDCGILVGPAGASGFIAIANHASVPRPALRRYAMDRRLAGCAGAASRRPPSRTNLAFGPVKSKAVMIPRAELLKLTNRVN